MSTSTYVMMICGLRFFYTHTLHRKVAIERIPSDQPELRASGRRYGQWWEFASEILILSVFGDSFRLPRDSSAIQFAALEASRFSFAPPSPRCQLTNRLGAQHGLG